MKAQEKIIMVVLCTAVAVTAGCKKKEKPGAEEEQWHKEVSFDEAKKKIKDMLLSDEGEADPLTPPPEVPKDHVKALSDGSNSFALEMYHRLRTGKEDQNLFYSPYSLYSALLLAYGGAKGETESQMRKTLHLTLEKEALHKTVKYVNWNMKKKDVLLSIANRLWGQKGYKFHQSYLDITKEYYNAQLKELDLQGDPGKAADIINEWVEKKTNKKIQNLITPENIHSLTRLILTNAIYFNGTWKNQFEKDQTKDDSFTLLDGTVEKVPMMFQSEFFNYGSDEKVQILGMHYRGEEMTMWVLLPKMEDSNYLESFEESLTKESLDKLLSLADGREKVIVYLPKFKMTSSFRLGAHLKTMGMEAAFDQAAADFSGIADANQNKERLFLDEAIQKAFVDVNEEGTEAAAATGVFGAGASSQQPPVFKADHPFLFLIRENNTGAVLFLGRVVNPLLEQ